MRRSALVVALALAVTMAVAPASTYSTGTVDRASSMAVTSDQNAAIAVDTPDASGASPSGDFVTVTNRLNVDQTVTVRLDNKTNEYDLSTMNDMSGSPDRVQVELAPGESVPVDYEGSGQPKGDARFTVETTGAVSATLPDRVRRIDDPGGGPPGGGGDDPACNNPGKGPKRCR
jgi:hypothetical protein